MNQNGIALLTGLVFLAAVSLLALAASNGMVLQRHQAANFEEKTLAAENAAIAEAQARSWILSRPDVERQKGCVSDCVLPVAIRQPGESGTNPEFESAAWWQINGIQAGLHPESGEAVGVASSGAEAARWIVEEIQYQAAAGMDNLPVFQGLGWYRVLSRGTGRQAGSVAVTEAIVARPWEGDFEVASFPAGSSSATFCSQFSEDFPCGTLAWRQRR
jgi:Tfp pilus assembly protein PilX